MHPVPGLLRPPLFIYPTCWALHVLPVEVLQLQHQPPLLGLQGTSPRCLSRPAACTCCALDCTVSTRPLLRSASATRTIHHHHQGKEKSTCVRELNPPQRPPLADLNLCCCEASRLSWPVGDASWGEPAAAAGGVAWAAMRPGAALDCTYQVCDAEEAAFIDQHCGT